MPSKRILDIGNCGPDHHSLTMMVSRNFDGATVDQAHQSADALAFLEQHEYALAVVNRLLDSDGSEGMKVIHKIKESYPDLPVMLVTNYEEHQRAAIDAGCEQGYGKNDLFSPATIEMFGKYLT